ncbi:MAG: tetratricopeptide repeat protein [Rhodospirillaceae bacterium]
MKSRKSLIFITVTAALITGVVGHDRSSLKPSLVDKAKMANLFDPRFVGGSMCGHPGDINRSFLRKAFEATQASQVLASVSLEGNFLLPPLYDDLGSLAYKISTSFPDAQAYFNQGLRFVYAFNHAEAIRSFRAAQQVDPNCALCAWGEAYALGPNINAAMAPNVVEPALAALMRAQAAARNASSKEQAIIKATAVRYGPDASTKPASYNQAFATAMLEVQAAFPEDLEIALITAAAIMNENPWTYWEADGRTAAGRNGQAVSMVEGVLAKNPDHPGAIHLYIHLVEASTKPERAEPFADTLLGLMPGAGHIVHMPSHIYYRIGRYKDSLETNLVAVSTDEAYFQRPEAIKGGMYELGYYPHNVHFVLVSAQMAGDARTSIEFAAKIDEILPNDGIEAATYAHPIKVAPLFAHAQFSEAETILSLPEPSEGAPYVQAMWHYARAIAFAKQKQFSKAYTEVDAIAELNDSANFRALSAGGVPAQVLLSIAQQVSLGRIAQAEGDLGVAIKRFEAGAELQDTINYMEPPYWYYPIRQSLGAAYLAAGQVDDSIQEFKASLILAPNNAWSLYGLEQAYAAKGDAVAAKFTNDLLLKAWIDQAAVLDLSQL